jgi:hypothetical protein
VIALFKGGESDSPCEPLSKKLLVNEMVHPYSIVPKTLVMRPCTPTLIVRLFGTSTWEDLGLVAAYNTVVRAFPESACFL